MATPGVCKLCREPTAGVVCGNCKHKLGLTPGDGVRSAQPCARCNHPVLVRALVRELTVEPYRDDTKPQTVPMGATYAPSVHTSFWSGQPTGTAGAEPQRAYGILEMYVCRRCGFTEWYCRDPQNIPIGEEFGTEEIDTTPRAPYR